jgi:hypothetical protein
MLGLCGLLACVTVAEWLPGAARTVPVPVARTSHTPTQSAPADDLPDTDELADAVIARPIFTIGRRPPKVVPADHQAGGASLPRLAGIMITPGGRRAIFMPEGTKPLVLAEGATVGDHTINRIAKDRVYLSGNTVLTPTLDKQRSTQGAATGTSPFVPGEQPGFARPPFQPGFPGQIQTTPPPEDNPDNTDGGPPPRPPVNRPPFMRPGMPGWRPPQGRE